MGGIYPTSGSNPLLAGLSGLNSIPNSVLSQMLEDRSPLGIANRLASTVLTGSPPPPPTNGLGALSSLLTPAAQILQWQFVRRRYGRFLANLALTADQEKDGEMKRAGITACLNRGFWGHNSESTNSLLIGSWGKSTHIRPPKDVDILFLLPSETYFRFENRAGNRQSQLLQNVKTVLEGTYSQTRMRGDGQVVMVPFNSILVEVVPGFRCGDGSIFICDTNDGGRYRTSTAEAEAIELSGSDLAWNGNTRALVRMMKRWQREHDVALKSFHIERLAVEFLRVWPYSNRDLFWYDWMIRDFLAFLIQRADTYMFIPGTGEAVWLGSEWRPKAERAYKAAISACGNEQGNYEYLAGSDWQSVFGNSVPLLVS